MFNPKGNKQIFIENNYLNGKNIIDIKGVRGSEVFPEPVWEHCITCSRVGATQKMSQQKNDLQSVRTNKQHIWKLYDHI